MACLLTAPSIKKICLSGHCWSPSGAATTNRGEHAQLRILFEREKSWGAQKSGHYFVDSSSIRGTWAPPSEATYALIWVVTPLIPANIRDVHVMRSMNSSSARLSLLPQLLLTTTPSRCSKQNPCIVSTYLWAVPLVLSKILECFYIKTSNCKILKPWSSQKRNYNIIYCILHVNFMSKNIRTDPPTPLMFVSLQ